MNYITWRLLNAGFRLINPRFWIQNSPTDYHYDAALRRALDEHGISSVEGYHCHVGKVQIWISNYPYAFGYVAMMPEEAKVLPAPLTRVRLRRALTMMAFEVGS